MFIQKLMDYFPFYFPVPPLFLFSLTSYYVQSGAMQITFIIETLWDDSHNQNVAIDGCKLFRGDRRGGKGGGIALYIKGGMDCEGPSLKNGHEQIKSLWVRVRD